MSEKFRNNNSESNQPTYEQWLADESLSPVNEKDLLPSPNQTKEHLWSEQDVILAEKILNLVNANSEGFEETSLPLMRLHLFNYSRDNKNADDGQLLFELNRMKRFSNLEKEYGMIGNPLPTVGIEFEIPKARLTSEMKKTLLILRVDSEHEPTGQSEINPAHAYSPFVPGKIIQEIWKAGLVRNMDKVGNEPVEGELSLHLNYGFPKGLGVAYSSMQRITDLLTYAFTSPERIESRKTNNSLAIHSENVRPSNKFGESKRTEIRPTEFKDKSSFRMIAEGQLVTALLIARSKQDQKYETTEIEKMLAEQYLKFDDELCKLFDEYKLKPRHYDKKNKEGEILTLGPIQAEQLEPFFNDIFVEKCRSLMTEHARKAALTIKEGMKKNKNS